MENMDAYVSSMKQERETRQAGIVQSVVELPAHEIFEALKCARDTKAWLLRAKLDQPKAEPAFKWLEEMQAEAISDLDVMINALKLRVVH
jgi:hypothetical protein